MLRNAKKNDKKRFRLKRASVFGDAPLADVTQERFISVKLRVLW